MVDSSRLTAKQQKTRMSLTTTTAMTSEQKVPLPAVSFRTAICGRSHRCSALIRAPSSESRPKKGVVQCHPLCSIVDITSACYMMLDWTWMERQRNGCTWTGTATDQLSTMTCFRGVPSQPGCWAGRGFMGHTADAGDLAMATVPARLAMIRTSAGARPRVSGSSGDSRSIARYTAAQDAAATATVMLSTCQIDGQCQATYQTAIDGRCARYYAS